MAHWNVEDDPFTTLAKRLTASQWMAGKIEVITGAPGAARNTAPNRIVIYPTTGTGLAPAHPLGGPLGQVALRDVDQTITAAAWGATFPLAWDIVKRLCWALEEQGQATDDGVSWTLSGLDWEKAQDTTKQGIGVDVHFTARLPIPPAPEGVGNIESTSLTRV